MQCDMNLSQDGGVLFVKLLVVAIKCSLGVSYTEAPFLKFDFV